MKKYTKYLILAFLLVPTFSFASIDSDLKYGMSGSDVSQLQDLLVSENCLSVSPTGYFGLLTLEGVKCFQAKYNISPVSGYFGVLSRTQANGIISDALTDSNKDEENETGTISLTPCAPGDLFDITTGKSCSQVASSTSDIEQTVNEIKQQVTQQSQDIQDVKKEIVTTSEVASSTPEVVPPTAEIGNQECDVIDRFGDTPISYFPLTIDGNWYEGIISVTATDASSTNYFGGEAIQYGLYPYNDPDHFGWLAIKPGNYNFTVNLTDKSGKNILSKTEPLPVTNCQ